MSKSLVRILRHNRLRSSLLQSSVYPGACVSKTGTNSSLLKSSPHLSSTVSPRYFSDNVKDNNEATKEAETEVPVEETVIVDRLESMHIMTIGISRPDKRNCVNTETAEKLKVAFQEFDSDENMHCCVLHGLGGNFCAGYDLEELAELEDDLANKIAEILMDQGPMGPTKMTMNKPVIAAIDGYCVAGGLELALMCDLRVVEENSKLGFLNRRFGVPLIDGGTVRLPELIGLSRAMDLILTGRLIEPKEALDWGLANRIVATGTAYGQAVNLAKQIVKFPQECLRADRESALYATFSSKSAEDSLEFESQNAAQVLTTESIQGAKKFMAGLGRGAKFNVNKVTEMEEWQKELEEMKNKQDPK